MRKDELLILSPHRDDAVFSLFIAIERWRGVASKITILNFFTESAWAPRALSSSLLSVSDIRAAEDRQALRCAGPDLIVQYAGLLDAPLRLGIAPSQISTQSDAAADPDAIKALSAIIRPQAHRAVVVAPLGVGNHVDHLLVRAAALQCVPGAALAFYEDLPYAMWANPEDLLHRVRTAAFATRVALHPVVLRSAGAIARKRACAQRYSSQITPQSAREIAAFAARYGSGERIWAPRRSIFWNRLLNVSQSATRRATTLP